jgi:hypothetical protein
MQPTLGRRKRQQRTRERIDTRPGVYCSGGRVEGRVKPPSSDYEAPTTLADAVSLLDADQFDAEFLAGRRSLIPLLNMRLTALRFSSMWRAYRDATTRERRAARFA